MDIKSNLVKSKSSNSAITNRSAEHRNKKSWSNAEFQPNVLKKRGVYVEKRATKIDLNEPDQERPVRPPPRPRPGQKRFLSSVLTILSKSTTGTQYPDSAEIENNRKRERTKRLLRRKERNDNLPNENGKRKLKYRSKVLNDGVIQEMKQKQVLILQSKKEIPITPSIFSENESLNISALVKQTQNMNIGDNEEEIVNTLTQQLEEGQNSKKVRIDEPATLVSYTDNTKTGSDKKLYKFFVDLLESTISVYNVKTEYEKTMHNSPSETSSTNVPLEINESVAQKLQIKCEKPEKVDVVNKKPSNHFYCLREGEESQGFNTVPSPPTSTNAPSKLSKGHRRKKLSESYSFLRKPMAKKIQSDNQRDEYLFSQKKKKAPTRKQKKKTLMNLFREQLKMDDDAFEEPQSIYEALRLMAQNKRRCQRAIHFDMQMGNRNLDCGFPECRFKCRKVISPSTKFTRKNKKSKSFDASINSIKSQFGSFKKDINNYNTDYDESYHSLEVYGIDYENNSVKKPDRRLRERQVVFTYRRTPTDSLNQRSRDDLLDADSMNFYNDLKACSSQESWWNENE